LASQNGHVDLARMLIEHGADMSTQTEDGSTALHLASLNGHLDLAQLLVDVGGVIGTLAITFG
jgi:ankyrin repeat protein